MPAYDAAAQASMVTTGLGGPPPGAAPPHVCTMHLFAAPASAWRPHSLSLRQIWNPYAPQEAAQLVAPYASQQTSPSSQSLVSLHFWSVPVQAPLGPTHLSVPASPVAWQHDVWLVSHMVLPHGTIPGSQPAPPSGAWQVTGIGPPLLVPPSGLTAPPSPTGVGLPRPSPPPLLDPPPVSAWSSPPLLEPLPDPPDPLPELCDPPSGVAVELELLQSVNARAAATETTETAATPTCILFIGFLIKADVHAGSRAGARASRGHTLSGPRSPRELPSGQLLICTGQLRVAAAHPEHASWPETESCIQPRMSGAART